MDWELRGFSLADGGPVRRFEYEVALKGLTGTPQLYYRGEGEYGGAGRVELHREPELRELLAGTPVNAQQMIEHLELCVRARAEKLMRQRMREKEVVTGGLADSH